MADKFRPFLSCLSCLPFFQPHTDDAERLEDVPCQIEAGLYLGSKLATLNSQSLKKLNVTHILTLITSEETLYPEDFIYKKIKVGDPPHANIEHHFDECIGFIDEAKKEGGLVLVHSNGDLSESAAIVIVYLMKRNDQPLLMALDHVLSKVPQMNLEEGLMSQLEELESFLAASKIQEAVEVQENSKKAIEIGLCSRETVKRRKLTRVFTKYRSHST